MAATIEESFPEASEELIAAVLLHDAPYFAPASVDLDAVLTEEVGADVVRIVRAIEQEHRALSEGDTPDLPVDDRDAIIASAADKYVSIDTITSRAYLSSDRAAYWDQRRPFVARVPYFVAFATEAEPYLPPNLADKLTVAVIRAADITEPYRPAATAALHATRSDQPSVC
ncbi:metal-dependent phosphohydrolase hd sub domain-containing protein [Actinoplanes sp. N902-109]|nr:metal-dependent phosphohydrolase hd sub domain-containing protein [Actinoplanes sp. N902-109]